MSTPLDLVPLINGPDQRARFSELLNRYTTSGPVVGEKRGGDDDSSSKKKSKKGLSGPVAGEKRKK